MKKNDETTPSYQALKQALDAILVRLQHEDTDVDEAVKLHAEGQKILSQLDAYLKAVSKKTNIDIKRVD